MAIFCAGDRIDVISTSDEVDTYCVDFYIIENFKVMERISRDKIELADVEIVDCKGGKDLTIKGTMKINMPIREFDLRLIKRNHCRVGCSR